MRDLAVHRTKFRPRSHGARWRAGLSMSSTTCCKAAFACSGSVSIRRRNPPESQPNPTWSGGQAGRGPGSWRDTTRRRDPPSRVAGGRTAWHRQRGAHFSHTGGGGPPPNRPLRSITIPHNHPRPGAGGEATSTERDARPLSPRCAPPLPPEPAASGTRRVALRA